MYFRPQLSGCFPPVSAPIDSLPVELLAYIFVLGAHEPISSSEREDDDCQPFNSDSVKAPLVYASVSRHWRSVALTTPALFTSLCITPELLCEVENKEVLDTTGISSYLALSQSYLVDILIDARDQEWDFEEDGPWFSAEHMSTAMGVLLPHLGRWRSLSILTDVFSPMRAALRPLEVYLSTYGAPHLESLRLMRCDAYAAHAPIAEPEHAFLSSIAKGGWMLPSLRHLTLRGVPAAWESLSTILPYGLKTLELSFHPLAAQPSVSELVCLLKAAPSLSRLVMNGSGPAFPDPATEPTLCETVSLPLLTSLMLGYTSTDAGLALFDVLAAPHLHTLALEDASHPAETVPVDAVPLLTRLFPPAMQPLFPGITHLALRRAHLASPPPPVRVESLELVATDPAALALEATQTLCVRGSPFALASGSSLLVDPAAQLAATGAALQALVAARGAAAPRVICLHEAAYSSHVGDPEEFLLGTTCIKVFRRLEEDEEGDGDEDTVMGSEPECGWDGEDEAFKVGGVFNDPVFDARYGYGYVG